MKRLWLVAGALIGAGAIVGLVLLVVPKSPIPAAVRSQLTSTLILPQLADARVTPGSPKYDGGLKLLTFTARVYGTDMVVSEQPTPDSFTDIPQTFEKVVAGMNEYSKFDTDIGTVHLTRPADLKGKQAAVLNTKGTLLFAKPGHDLTGDQWRKLFASFEVEK